MAPNEFKSAGHSVDRKEQKHIILARAIIDTRTNIRTTSDTLVLRLIELRDKIKGAKTEPQPNQPEGDSYPEGLSLENFLTSSEMEIRATAEVSRSNTDKALEIISEIQSLLF